MNKRQLITSIFLGLLFLSLITPSLYAVTSRKAALISFMEDCKTDSGFTNIPGASITTLEATFHAIYILNSYDQLDDIDTDSVLEFVNNCRNADHGYGNDVNATSDIYATFYALWMINLLDVQPDNETDEWVTGLYNETKGFKEQDGTDETLYATYFGIESVYLLNETGLINETDLANYNFSNRVNFTSKFNTWLLNRQNTNPTSEGYGGFATDGNSSNLWTTWAAMGSISRLNVSGFLIEPLVSWINQSQNLNSNEDDYGAFSSGPSESDDSLLNTYAALHSLQKIADTYLSRVNKSATVDWLLNLQNEDGGFRVNSEQGDSSLSATYYAFCTLDLLGELDLLLSDVPWESKFQMPLWLWMLIGIVIVVIAILIIRKLRY